VTLQQVNIVDGPARPVRNLRLQRRYEGHAWEEAQRIVHCRTCGAELTMTQDLAHNCAFCGSTNVLVEDSGRTLEQPDGLLPFQVGKGQATEAIHQAQNAFARRLMSWFTGKQYALKELQGMYLPFWVFDGMVETYRYSKGFAQAQKESLGLTTHENLLFPGVDVPPPALLQRAYPFDLQTLTPYEARLLADWPAKLYSRDVELVSEQARSTMIGLTQQQRRPVVPRRQAGWHTRAQQWTEARTLAQRDTISSQVIGTTYQLVLLPLWVALLVSGDERHLALVNGQTGKAAFDAARRAR
jgi:hypothetical protein